MPAGCRPWSGTSRILGAVLHVCQLIGHAGRRSGIGMVCRHLRVSSATMSATCGFALCVVTWAVVATSVATRKTMRSRGATTCAWTCPAAASGTTPPTSLSIGDWCRWPRPLAALTSSHCPTPLMRRRGPPGAVRQRPAAPRRSTAARIRTHCARATSPWSWTPCSPRSWTTSARSTRPSFGTLPSSSAAASRTFEAAWSRGRRRNEASRRRCSRRSRSSAGWSGERRPHSSPRPRLQRSWNSPRR
mmetsp:Transcript_66739/g.217261  ORF Transcript_66739/g.217261 Transcript_66739/m.217261 type:complete len:246 (+) Transcript_66739:856-1593(+)